VNFNDWRWQFYIEQHDRINTQGDLFPDFTWRPMPPLDTYKEYEDDTRGESQSESEKRLERVWLLPLLASPDGYGCPHVGLLGEPQWTRIRDRDQGTG